ncbi:hypothetical protein GQ43DRAFT_432715 [Delitschia confertaspora ATCC 74209]|uniref:Uncharacterized protein n=1 Tax=Delitschia confertaspora ATCC 74209 TaxID=1513339 RepID=A0A9P4JN93_9PLEO|nr:hypothetical protein GQ43DRAFT_432715 [Delitschia confertaspora ATCC 74209]
MASSLMIISAEASHGVNNVVHDRPVDKDDGERTCGAGWSQARGQRPEVGPRKRSRNTSTSSASLPSHQTHNINVWSQTGHTPFSDITSPPPLANDLYELAGGIEETDTGDYHDDYFQLQNQRSGNWSLPVSPFPETTRPTLLNGTLQPSPSAEKPWVLNQLLTLVGGVAGKLVQFCSVPFKGFQAGGGQKFEIDPQGQILKADLEETPDDKIPPIRDGLPGRFPSEDSGFARPASVDDNPSHDTKRLRMGDDKWVVVDRKGGMDSRAGTPRLSERRTPLVPKHASPSQIPRPVSRLGTIPALHGRPSLIPVSRRTSYDKRLSQATPKGSVKTCGTPRSYNRPSYGSPLLSATHDLNLPPESQRLINKIRREEEEDDARMRKMSAQTAAMLREAREALGSKVEIDDDYMDF